ncbi:unnamed protein product [Effrenium voratum]|uniref:Uncharacterized protein n=2 Tax=Effrenium voratum TaxID=2562239 RepID=A0AA36MS65_9DINO|nr:unnamed protein product [Effrenium voratum]
MDWMQTEPGFWPCLDFDVQVPLGFSQAARSAKAALNPEAAEFVPGRAALEWRRCLRLCERRSLPLPPFQALKLARRFEAAAASAIQQHWRQHRVSRTCFSGLERAQEGPAARARAAPSRQRRRRGGRTQSAHQTRTPWPKGVWEATKAARPEPIPSEAPKARKEGGRSRSQPARWVPKQGGTPAPE